MCPIQVKQSLEDELIRKKTSVTEEMKGIEPYKIRYLRFTRVFDDLQTSYSSATIKPKPKAIVIKGLPGEVSNIKVGYQIFTFKNQNNSVSVFFCS